MIVICVFLGMFRTAKSRAPCSARIMQWKQRLNVVNISNGWEISLNYRKNRRMIAICVCLFFFRRLKTRTLRSACKMKWNERINDDNISNWRDITHNFEKNRRMIAICVRLVSCRRWKSRELRSARLMQWKEHLNVEISQTGWKYRIIIDKIDEWLRFACFWACFEPPNRVRHVPHA